MEGIRRKGRRPARTRPKKLGEAPGHEEQEMEGKVEESEAEYDSAEQEVEDKHMEVDYEFDEDHTESAEYEEWWRTVNIHAHLHEPDEEEFLPQRGMAAVWLDPGFRS
eukprot:3480997-Heterocapsa_arctica.AAC.1